jgi:ribonuclease BN (tRNA processing enzyme)
VSIRALRVDHPPVTDCFALRFEAGGKAVVFSSDTCHFPPLGPFSAGADLLVHEAMLVDAVDNLIARTPGAGRLREHLMASHTRADDAGRIASAGQVGRLVLHHLLPADDPAFTTEHWQAEVARTWNGPVTVGRDGMVIPF